MSEINEIKENLVKEFYAAFRLYLIFATLGVLIVFSIFPIIFFSTSPSNRDTTAVIVWGVIFGATSLVCTVGYIYGLVKRLKDLPSVKARKFEIAVGQVEYKYIDTDSGSAYLPIVKDKITGRKLKFGNLEEESKKKYFFFGEETTARNFSPLKEHTFIYLKHTRRAAPIMIQQEAVHVPPLHPNKYSKTTRTNNKTTSTNVLASTCERALTCDKLTLFCGYITCLSCAVIFN